MDAEEFLRSKTAYCERLRMRLTPEGCQKLRTRNPLKRWQLRHSDEDHNDGPPPQCADCAGLSMPQTDHIVDVNDMVVPQKTEPDHVADVSNMIMETPEDYMSDTQSVETPPAARRTYTTREIAELLGVYIKDVRNAMYNYTLAAKPQAETKRGRVLLYMREHGIMPEDILPTYGGRPTVEPVPDTPPLSLPDDRPLIPTAALTETPAPIDEQAAAPEPAGLKEKDAPAPDPAYIFTTGGQSLYIPDIKEQYEVLPSSGVKHDEGKLRLDLIPPEILRALGEVLTYGADKYTDRNWERGIALDRVYAALMRHLLAWREGEAVDRESGLPHLAHALTNAGMLLTLDKRQGG